MESERRLTQYLYVSSPCRLASLPYGHQDLTFTRPLRLDIINHFSHQWYVFGVCLSVSSIAIHQVQI
jgi:hypothetical protein